LGAEKPTSTHRRPSTREIAPKGRAEVKPPGMPGGPCDVNRQA